MLDSLGATKTQIVISGDLDEYSIEQLAHSPIDGFGVGTRLVTGSGAPTANFVYKLVAIDKGLGRILEPVAKTSAAKETLGGRKFAWRVFDSDNKAVMDFLELTDSVATAGRPSILGTQKIRPLLKTVVRHGEPVLKTRLDDMRALHLDSLGELDDSAKEISAGNPALDTLLLDSNGNLVRAFAG